MTQTAICGAGTTTYDLSDDSRSTLARLNFSRYAPRRWVKTSLIVSSFLFSSNVWKDGMTVRAHAKQCLLRRPWLLPSDREIPSYWENLESKVKRVHQSRTFSVPLKRPHLTEGARTNQTIPVRSSILYWATEHLDLWLSPRGVGTKLYQLSYGTV